MVKGRAVRPAVARLPAQDVCKLFPVRAAVAYWCTRRGRNFFPLKGAFMPLSLTCKPCEVPFTSAVWRFYCPTCVTVFTENIRKIKQMQRPAPHIQCAGVMVGPEECPEVGVEPVTGAEVCGVCGGTDIYPEYGFCGYGLGTFTRCFDRLCGAVLNFTEDTGE